jgi:outer membrane lipoprotein-sorting protein
MLNHLRKKLIDNNKKMNTLKITLIAVLGILLYVPIHGQTAYEIIKQADEKLKGESSYAEFRMTINRVDWNRTIEMKAWSKGDEESLILVTAPKRDKGTAFLKKDDEMWNWQPTIERVIKMPPSMMMQSWMGSDFTNDDLVQESSIVKDYTHEFVGEETIEGRLCHVIELIPKENAPVVWAKVKIWISKTDLLQLKVEFYDEDDYLVNTMYGQNIKELGGRLLPSIMKIVPEDEPGNSTVLEYLNLQFGVKHPGNFFSIQNMKRIR